MMLFWNNAGPLLRYEKGLLVTESLNPETRIQWRMSRGEMFRTGIKFIIAAVKGRSL